MRISYWSSDGCSSDLSTDLGGREGIEEALEEGVHAGDGISLSLGVRGHSKLIWGGCRRRQSEAGFRRSRIIAGWVMIAAKLRPSRAKSAGQLPGRGPSGGVRKMSSPLTAVLLGALLRSEEHPSELQSLMRISYAVFCL